MNLSAVSLASSQNEKSLKTQGPAWALVCVCVCLTPFLPQVLYRAFCCVRGKHSLSLQIQGKASAQCLHGKLNIGLPSLKPFPPN